MCLSKSEEDREKFVIGLDCSTSSTKAIVYDKQGHIIYRAAQSLSLSSPEPNYYEQNDEDWWKAAKAVLSEITSKINANRIEAIAISNQRETFVPLDKDGNSLRPAILWLDERCKPEVKPFAQKIGAEKIHQITGKPPDYAPVVYRLAWMKNHEPELFQKIYKVCDVHTYLAWKLTGSFKTSTASADPLGLFDMEQNCWSSLILDTLELKETQLPETFSPGTILGAISREASGETGLNIQTLVVAGAGDGQAAGLGTNTLAPERAYLNLGTAAVAGVYGKQYRTSKAFRTMIACADKGFYYECSLRAGTFAIDWFVKNILKVDPDRQPDIYKQLEEEAEVIPDGSESLLYLPYLNGAMNPYWDVNARGAFVGLSSSHSRGHMYRAILEGIAFEQLFAMQEVEKDVGIKVKELVAIGGGSSNILWCEILANVTGKNIILPQNKEASSLGASIAAAIGADWYPSFEEAAKEMKGPEEVIEPNNHNHERYLSFFEAYKEIYPYLKKVYENL